MSEKTRVVPGTTIVWEVPLLVFGTLGWRNVVREHQRLGRTFGEAAGWVNQLLTDHATIPERIRPHKLDSFTTIPYEPQ